VANTMAKKILKEIKDETRQLIGEYWIELTNREAADLPALLVMAPKKKGDSPKISLPALRQLA